MISVAMATYNGAEFVHKQIDSILSQTIQDFELIISDDCSTDETWQIVIEYASKDKRIKISRNEENIGYRRNFEKLVLQCKGDFIAFCDQDDIWFPNHLEVLYSNIGNFDACSADAEIIDAKGLPLHRRLSDFTQLRYWSPKALVQAYTYMYYRNPFPGCNTMYRTSFLLQAYPIYCDTIQLHDTWADTLACIYGKGINYVNEVIMYYRFHSNSVTAGSKRTLSQSPIRCLLRKFISGIQSHKFRYVKDRKQYCEEIYKRKYILNKEQSDFVNQAYKYHSRRDTLLGRFKNLLFDLKHYQKIYNSKILW